MRQGSKARQGEGVYYLEVCGDTFELSLPANILIFYRLWSLTVVITRNIIIITELGWGVRAGTEEISSSSGNVFPRNMKKVVGLFDVWSVQAVCSVSIDLCELDTTDGRKCYLLSQWWIFWLILTPTLGAGYFSVCLILHYWDWDNLALLNIHQNILPTHITDNRPSSLHQQHEYHYRLLHC